MLGWQCHIAHLYCYTVLKQLNNNDNNQKRHETYLLLVSKLFICFEEKIWICQLCNIRFNKSNQKKPKFCFLLFFPNDQCWIQQESVLPQELLGKRVWAAPPQQLLSIKGH